MIKKFLLAASILSGVLMAGQAFAAAYSTGSVTGMPMMTASGTAGQYQINKIVPGQNMMYATRFHAGPFSGGEQAAWFALMFVITVALVWVILLLLIAVLWHKLCEQRHHHREHHHK